MRSLPSQETLQTKYSLSQKFKSAIRLLDLDGHACNNTFVCTSETEKSGLQDLTEDHLGELLGCGPLCTLKESPAGRGGSVDFLAFDLKGRVFLVEVKRAKDQRAKYDVVFQVLKYHCSPNDILHKLSSSRRDFESELSKQLGLNPQEASELARKARKNIENRLMNAVVVVDEATYPLIAHAYSLALREIQGELSELRVIEVNLQHIQSGAVDADFVYIRRYFSSDSWIGNETLGNRKPTEYGSLEDALRRIPDTTISQKVARLMEETGANIRAAKSKKNFTIIKKKAYFTWDPSGEFTTGMGPRMARPKNPFRIVVTEDKPDVVRRLIDSGFHQEPSLDGERTYCVFDLRPSTTDEDVTRLATAIRELS